MEEGAVLCVEDGLEFGDNILNQLFGSFVIWGLDCLKDGVEVFLVRHIGDKELAIISEFGRGL